MTQLDEPTPHQRTHPSARRSSWQLATTLLKVAVVLFVCEFAVMCVIPAIGLEGMWGIVTGSLLLTIGSMSALYALGFFPHSLIETDPRRRTRLERRMVFLLATDVAIVLLVIAVYGLFVSGQEFGSRMISVAGRQRMLPQRLVQAAMMESMELAHADLIDKKPKSSEAIAEYSAQFEQALRGLAEGDAKLGLVPCPSLEAGRHLEAVGAAWHQFRALLKRTSEPTGRDEAQAYYGALQRAGDRVLAEMNEAVGLLEDHYEGRVRLLRTLLGPTIVLAAGISILLVITVRRVMGNRKKAEAELLRVNEDLIAVNEVHQGLFCARTKSDVAITMTDALVHHFDAYFARVWLIEPGDLCSQCAHAKECRAKERCLHLVSSSGRYTHIDGDHRRVPVGAFKIGLIAEGRGKTICNDVVNDERVHDRKWAAQRRLRSFAGFPLVRDGEVVGVMAMFSRHELPKHLLDTLELLAQLGGSALSNVERIEALRASESRASRLSVAVEQSPASVVVTDTKGTIEYVNPMFSKVTGYTAEEAVGRNPRILKSGNWPPKAYERMWRKILAGEVWTGEFHNKKKNGELYWEAASISSVRNAEGEIIRFVAVKLDITKTKQAEVELRRLADFPESNPHPILEIQPDGQVNYCNPAGWDMLERLGPSTREPEHLLPESYREDVDFCLRERIEVCCPEFELDGRTIGWSFRHVPGADLVHAYGRDITERKQAEEAQLRHQEVEQERNALRGAVKAQERLLGVVGHELRTPLAGIRAIAELLIDEGSRDMEEFDVFLRNIHDEVVRMSGMVNDLLEVARMHSGAAQWNWGEVSMRQACEAAVSTVRPLIDQDNLELSIEVHPADLMMRGDKDGIRRLVLNLLNNACKNTLEGSIYVLATASDHDGHAFVNLTVGDTGTGMTPEVARRLGQAFALNSGVVGDSHVKGSGLGLAICRGIATAHGGTITVKSSQGQGSMFTALLQADLEGPMSAEKETQIECEVT